jgi:hypothetical protein
MGLYLLSLTQECFCTSHGCGDKWQGAYIVGLGAIGGIMSAAGFTWYANPALWLSWMFFKKRSTKALPTSFIALAIALSFLLFTQIADNEAGVQSTITGYRAGYWLWITSMSVTVAGSFILYPWMKMNKSIDEIQPFIYNEEQLKKMRS